MYKRQSLYWKKVHHKPKKFSKSFIPVTLLKVSLPLLFVQATNTISNSIDSITIGFFLSMKDVGLYAVAFKIALMSSFFLQVTNAILAPKVATMFSNNEIDKLEKMVQRVTLILMLIGFTVLLVVITGGKYVLLIWGSDFSEAYIPLVILSLSLIHI